MSIVRPPFRIITKERSPGVTLPGIYRQMITVTNTVKSNQTLVQWTSFTLVRKQVQLGHPACTCQTWHQGGSIVYSGI